MKKKIYLISLIVFIIDQISKIFIVNMFSIGESIKVIPNILYITYINNSGAAWGILKDQVLLLIIISFLVILYIIKLINESNSLILNNKVAFGILLGGILGNFIDRMIYGHVIDFIDIYIFNYDFPIFNISDSAIVIGMFIIIYDMIVKGDRYNEIVNS